MSYITKNFAGMCNFDLKIFDHSLMFPLEKALCLLQVSPQQFIPAAAATGGATPYGQVMQPALFPLNPQQYPISPGVVAAAPAPSPVISPPITRPGGFPLRLPMMSPGGTIVDGGIPPSPPHHLAASGGVTLVRPIAQVATPTRVRSRVLVHLLI